MKKFFSLVLALVMALSLTTVAWGAATVINNDSELVAAVASDADIELDANIVLTDNLTIASGVTVTIDLKGYTISQEKVCTASYEMITNKGNLTINDSVGGGKISFKDTGAGDSTFGWGSYTVRNNGGTLVVNGGTIEHLGEQNPGNGQPNVHMYCAIDQYTGSTTINGGTISTPTYRSARLWMGDMTINGGTFIGQLWVQNMQNGTKLTINGGTFSPMGNDGSSVYIDNGSKTVDLSITDGTFTTKVGYADASTIAGSISGGTFAVAPDDALLADGKQLLANGTVVTTPAASATDPVLYKWDNAGAEWDAYFIATGKTLDKLAQDSSDDCLPCYLINGEYFVEVKEAAATYKLVYGAKTVFLAPVAEKLVKYEDTASVLTVVDAEDAECGDYYVANLDEDDVYYISYNKKGEVDGIWVKDKNGSEQILVNGKIVDAEDASSDVTFMFHKFKGYDVVNKQYTTVKCEECGKVAKLYANATAATVGKKDAVKIGTLGWITFADYMDFGANAPVVTDKVTSAETFDAGIAMYVGMSVMAAAGSAVVLKKRED